MRDIKDKNKLLDEKVRLHEDNKKKTYNQMMVLEDKCKDLKQKLNMVSGAP